MMMATSQSLLGDKQSYHVVLVGRGESYSSHTATQLSLGTTTTCSSKPLASAITNGKGGHQQRRTIKSSLLLWKNVKRILLLFGLIQLLQLLRLFVYDHDDYDLWAVHLSKCTTTITIVQNTTMPLLPLPSLNCNDQEQQQYSHNIGTGSVPGIGMIPNMRMLNFFSAATNTKYEDFLPLYAFFALSIQKDAVVEMVVVNSTAFIERKKDVPYWLLRYYYSSKDDNYNHGHGSSGSTLCV